MFLLDLWMQQINKVNIEMLQGILYLETRKEIKDTRWPYLESGYSNEECNLNSQQDVVVEERKQTFKL